MVISKSMRAAGQYLTLGAATMGVGLTLHILGARLLGRWQDPVGDALWAAMMGAWVSFVASQQKPQVRYVVALFICYAVEISQLWHAPLLDSIRANRVGRLVLGSGFDPWDFVAYTLGILLFVVLDQQLIMRQSRALPQLPRRNT